MSNSPDYCDRHTRGKATHCHMLNCSRRATWLARQKYADGHVSTVGYCGAHRPAHGRGSYSERYGEALGHGRLEDVTVERRGGK